MWLNSDCPNDCGKICGEIGRLGGGWSDGFRKIADTVLASQEAGQVPMGQRLKGPGMRWSVRNVNPMAALVSLWSDGQWDLYWQSAA